MLELWLQILQVLERLGNGLAAASYGGDKAIFGFGNDGSYTNVTNLVSNTGVVASDQTGVGTARGFLAAAAMEVIRLYLVLVVSMVCTNVTNLVSNTGVVASDTTGVGTARTSLAAVWLWWG